MVVGHPGHRPRVEAVDEVVSEVVERRPASLVAVRVARDAVGTAEDAPEVPPVVIAEPPKRPISPRLSSVVSGDPTGDVPSALILQGTTLSVISDPEPPLRA